jgi:hypothetical protein
MVEAPVAVVPFNQGPKQGVDVMADYNYSTLNLDLDDALPLPPFPKMDAKSMVSATSQNLRTA